MAQNGSTGLLRSALGHSQKQFPLLIVQYDLSVTPWPLIRHIITSRPKRFHLIVLALRHTSQTLLLSINQPDSNFTFLDWTERVVGYSSSSGVAIQELRTSLTDAIASASSESVYVLVDCVDVLIADFGLSPTYKLLSTLNTTFVTRDRASRSSSTLLLPVESHSPLLPQLSSSSFSSTLTHITLHSAYLIQHVSSTYLTSPPVGDEVQPSKKFWNVFLPAARRREGERVVLSGENGACRDFKEGVAEVLVRGGRRGPERTLEGWRVKETLSGDVVEACKCSELSVLKDLLKKTGPTKVLVQSETPDVTKGLSFNLSLTESQAEAKAQVVLPYAFEDTTQSAATPSAAAIHYDPDSADDLDDEDPDEDLDL